MRADARFGFAVVGVNGNRYSWIIYDLPKTSSLGWHVLNVYLVMSSAP